MGIDIGREALREWADKHRVKKIAVWTRGKACEALIDLLRNTTIRVEAVHDPVECACSWRGCAVKRFDQFRPHGVDGVVVGSLSCGSAEDLESDLRRRYPRRAVLNVAPWSFAPAQRLAVSA